MLTCIVFSLGREDRKRRVKQEREREAVSNVQAQIILWLYIYIDGGVPDSARKTNKQESKAQIQRGIKRGVLSVNTLLVLHSLSRRVDACPTPPSTLDFAPLSASHHHQKSLSSQTLQSPFVVWPIILSKILTWRPKLCWVIHCLCSITPTSGFCVAEVKKHGCGSDAETVGGLHQILVHGGKPKRCCLQ